MNSFIASPLGLSSWPFPSSTTRGQSLSTREVRSFSTASSAFWVNFRAALPYSDFPRTS